MREYYILDGRPERTQFFRLSARGLYIPIKPLKGGVIKSTVLPGFQFHVDDLFEKPDDEQMINDKIYKDFVLPKYAEEKQARIAAENRVQKAEAEIARLQAKLNESRK